MDLRSWVFDLRSWILGLGSRVFDLGSSILSLGSWALDLGFLILELGTFLQCIYLLYTIYKNWIYGTDYLPVAVIFRARRLNQTFPDSCRIFLLVPVVDVESFFNPCIGHRVSRRDASRRDASYIPRRRQPASSDHIALGRKLRRSVHLYILMFVL